MWYPLPPDLQTICGQNMFNSACDCKAPLHPFLRWWIRELFIHCIWVSTVYLENVNILQSTLVLTSWSQSELLSLSEPEYLCTCNYKIKFCEWFANICETLCPCDLHQHDHSLFWQVVCWVVTHLWWGWDISQQRRACGSEISSILMDCQSFLVSIECEIQEGANTEL